MPGQGKPFPKGKSGNPSGRPKEFFDLRERIKDEGVGLAYQALLDALQVSGERVPAAKTLLSYFPGLPAQTVRVEDELSKLSDEQLFERLRETGVLSRLGKADE